MSRAFSEKIHPARMSRRRFVTGLAVGAAFAGMGYIPLARAFGDGSNGQTELRGTDFKLDYSPTKVNFTGKARYATAINGSVPAPTLRFKEGETVTLNVSNYLASDTSIHWHGLILPPAQDGVPGISPGFTGIKPGQSFQYRFPIIQSGTYWYHSHSGFQEQTGAYGAIVIEPQGGYPFSFDREHVILLSDWSDEDPEDIYATLKKMPHYYNTRERTAGDALRQMREQGYDEFMADRQMWNQMRMSDRDISDVTGYTYTFLMNGVTPAEGWQGIFKKGERVLLRFINAGAMTFFDVRIPGLKMTVVAADGQYVEPVTVDEFRIGTAETFDVIVEPSVEQPYSIFAQAMDRSGYARGSLTPQLGVEAEVPEMDASPVLGHGDMGMAMDHSGHTMSGGQMMDHSGHSMGGAQPMDHSVHTMDSTDMVNHATHGRAAGETMDHSLHSMADSGPTDHSMHGMSGKLDDSLDGIGSIDDSLDGIGSIDDSLDRIGSIDDSLEGIDTLATPRGRRNSLPMGSGPAGFGSNRPVVHARTEYGPHIDMRADSAQYQLGDPGVGLRNNGRKVLTYADLFNLNKTVDPREPSREIDLHLTGNMSRYMWSLNGVKFADADPIELKYGERVRFNLYNDTMMNHPIHLHGMWSDLETGDPDYIPRKHTVVVQPGARISYLVTADARGDWAYHCHLMYHMMGMFRKVTVS